ncbi:ParB N-terminal domain-containing protein [Plantactinospora sp. S1510]|uniref:ParB N-terminal domain-containing protein n=1 Tax=Plantactinospora alkalitolerans TaxID=2789879 RepID=A0ABS0GTG9_9ACTN|nr:ParB N-terminal domain-containing protein [Plantactinospora alkalitolerans]
MVDTGAAGNAAHDKIEQQPVVLVEVDTVVLADSPRLSGVNDEHVEMLAAIEGPLPPIVVHRGTMQVIDGVHRLWAAARRGQRTIPVRFFDGDESEAFVLAVRLNVEHGLPLALADRKRATERIIASHPEWSDRRVASVTGTSPVTVAELRRRVVGEASAIGSRVGQDGRIRPLDGSAGRRLAGQLMIENPTFSLRQVARAARISPETARDVRNRLRNGQDLVPGRLRRDAAAAGEPAVGGGHEVATVSILLLPAQPPRQPVLDHAAAVNRLRSDPALRYSETGRNLLRLLSLHALWTEDWEGILHNLPPHCSGMVADLARQFADLWTDFAARPVQDVAQVG